MKITIDLSDTTDGKPDILVNVDAAISDAIRIATQDKITKAVQRTINRPKRNSRFLTPDKIEECYNMWVSSNKSFREIADATGISKTSVARIAAKFRDRAIADGRIPVI